MRTRWKHDPAKKKKRLVGLGLLAAVLAAFFGFDRWIRPTVQQVFAFRAKIYVTQTVNQAVLDLMEENQLGYAQMAKVQYNSEATPVAIVTDQVAINQLTAGLTRSVNESLREMSAQEIEIPLGTLTGFQLFSGLGPPVRVRIYPASYVNTTIESQFDQAGINQTRHRILAAVEVQVSAVMPGFRVKSDVSTSVGLAETVIMGVTPQQFAQLGDADNWKYGFGG